ncbi:stimulus-sensing domain-containing protein [Minwuia thermotolerans]|uniref:histidine kinase n=1 Tax=Minwuia thermotolerans TaxID=2056226 RepID=A0A2M9FXM8_9PROT|nr:stimulus-sensing domain-containing protein [Minwuia thermotolerans]PJK28216.1 histidine kinase [Minwuia thermotolerans]
MSPLARRILTINLPAFLVLVGAWFYLDQYRAGLLEARQQALEKEAHLIAGALGEAALAGPIEDLRIDATLAPYILRRAVVTTNARARLFDSNGRLMVDSRRLPASDRDVEARRLFDPDRSIWPLSLARDLWDRAMNWLPRRGEYPAYDEVSLSSDWTWPGIATALQGGDARQVWTLPDGRLLIGTAVPVQALKRVLGAVVLTVDSAEIDAAVRREQVGTLAVFAVAALITFLLSVFLSRSIIRPVQRLSQAADKVRNQGGQSADIPDLRNRHDEIGDLSVSLREMTSALNARVGAIETFAADVAHELKNPLTSLRSAVETLERAEKPEHREQLSRIILQDLARMNRLISEISDASRIDAEMGRIEREPVDIGRMVVDLQEVLQSPRPDIRIDIEVERDRSLMVLGAEHRLGQVLRNLVDNAVSFSPAGGRVLVTVRRDRADVVMSVEDQGPGVPEEARAKIFERFYSERPSGEDFGSHSGLGLNICRQIIEAHGGTIEVENIREVGKHGLLVGIRGARFTIRIPALARGGEG